MKFLRGLIFISALSSLVGHAQTTTASLFPKASCVVTEKLPDLKDHFIRNPLQQYGGDLPWPGIRGIWLNADRDLYITVVLKQTEDSKLAIATVTFRSVCTNRILAQGAKVITATDWQNRFLTVRLRNYALLGTRLQASIRVSPTSNLDLLEVKVQQNDATASKIGPTTQSTTRDWFMSSKF